MIKRLILWGAACAALLSLARFGAWIAMLSPAPAAADPTADAVAMQLEYPRRPASP